MQGQASSHIIVRYEEEEELPLTRSCHDGTHLGVVV